MAQNDLQLNWEQTLFKDMEVFDISYVPEQFNYRETQLQELSYTIKPALRGARIIPAVCRGLPGTGKTTSIHKLFDQITASTQKIVPIIVNCNIDSTEYAIFTRIYTKLTGNSHPASGTSLKILLDMLGKYVVQNNIVPLICLDDANYLIYNKQLNGVLYPLMRFHEEYEAVNFGVILVLSDLEVALDNVLDIRVRSVFRYETIEFPPYSAREVARILNDRINQGLYPRVMPSEMFDKIVDYTMQSGGDIRAGLDVIRRSALYAENDSRKQVGEEDLKRAFSAAYNTQLVGIIKSLSKDETDVLRGIVNLANRKEMTTKMIRESLKEKRMKITRFNEILEKLQNLQLISMEYFNDGKGRQRQVRLKYESKRLFDVMKDLEK